MFATCAARKISELKLLINFVTVGVVSFGFAMVVRQSTGFLCGRNSMKKAVSFSALLVVALLCSVSIPRASAQAVYGSILGTVTDPQGAAVVGAKVTVTDQNKGTSVETTTNESGNYSVTHLIADLYSI